MNNVREIWAADADTETIAPLTNRYPNARRVGSGNSYAFSTQLDVISPDSEYDKIDYKDLDMTGEELYSAVKSEIEGGFKGGQQLSKAQVYLMMDYDAIINPPEDAE